MQMNRVDHFILQELCIETLFIQIIEKKMIMDQ